MPLHRSRAERFDELVLDAVDSLEKRWEEALRSVEFAVEDVPPPEPTGPPEDPVPLGRVVPASDETPARIVIYRRPVETRALDRTELTDLVHDVVVEQVAELLGLDPGAVDPEYGDPDEDAGE